MLSTAMVRGRSDRIKPGRCWTGRRECRNHPSISSGSVEILHRLPRLNRRRSNLFPARPTRAASNCRRSCRKLRLGFLRGEHKADQRIRGGGRSRPFSLIIWGRCSFWFLRSFAKTAGRCVPDAEKTSYIVLLCCFGMEKSHVRLSRIA